MILCRVTDQALDVREMREFLFGGCRVDVGPIRLPRTQDEPRAWSHPGARNVVEKIDLPPTKQVQKRGQSIVPIMVAGDRIEVRGTVRGPSMLAVGLIEWRYEARH